MTNRYLRIPKLGCEPCTHELSEPMRPARFDPRRFRLVGHVSIIRADRRDAELMAKYTRASLRSNAHN